MKIVRSRPRLIAAGAAGSERSVNPEGIASGSAARRLVMSASMDKPRRSRRRRTHAHIAIRPIDHLPFEGEQDTGHRHDHDDRARDNSRREMQPKNNLSQAHLPR